MLKPVKPLTNWSVHLLGVALAGGAVQTALAEARPNPYQSIIERNPFGLKPPPPPPEPAPVTPVTPPAKVVLTGITTILGSPRALLEIIEQEPGKTPTPHKPVLHEGDRDGTVEVISIDVEKGLVKIRNGGLETNITFETPKLTASAQPAPGAFTPPPALSPALYSPPTAANGSGPKSSVTIFGNNSGSGSGAGFGGGNGAASPAAYGGYGAAGSGGYGAAGTSLAGAAGLQNTGLRQIPSRTLRTDASVPIDPAKQYLEMAVDHEIHNAAGRVYPPLPPPPP